MTVTMRRVCSAMVMTTDAGPSKVSLCRSTTKTFVTTITTVAIKAGLVKLVHAAYMTTLAKLGHVPVVTILRSRHLVTIWIINRVIVDVPIDMFSQMIGTV